MLLYQKGVFSGKLESSKHWNYAPTFWLIPLVRKLPETSTEREMPHRYVSLQGKRKEFANIASVGGVTVEFYLDTIAERPIMET